MIAPLQTLSTVIDSEANPFNWPSATLSKSVPEG